MKAILAGLTLLVTAACAASNAPTLPQADYCLSDGDTVLARITAEQARTAGERNTGLMDRQSLSEAAGMLFLYDSPRPADNAFWMYRTRIPLDIAYLDDQGRIRAIRAMDPCPSEEPGQCPRYKAGVTFSQALEMNQGFFDRHGVETGHFLLPASHPDCRG